MRRGAVILCGGESSRMGRAKALLPLGPELMLQRVVRLLGQVVDYEKMVVVAAQGQALPALPEQVLRTCDARPGRGPLEGMAAGMRALAGQVDAVYVTGCDVPRLVPALVERLFELLGEHAIVVPREAQFHHPLAAVYRQAVLQQVDTLLREERLRPFFLFERVDTLEIPVAALRKVDAELATLENINHPQDYYRVLQHLGCPAPEDLRLS